MTGIVVNEKLNITKEYKKKIRQEMHYINRFGIDEHLRRLCVADKQGYVRSLMGRITYVLQTVPNNAEFLSYKESLRSLKE